MQKILYSCTIWLALAVMPASALQRTWTLGVGRAQHAQFDELASPLRYSGDGATVALAYTRASPRGLSGVYLHYDRIRLTSRITRGEAQTEAYSRTRLGVPYVRTIRGGQPGGGALGVGVELGADLLLREHEYGMSSETYADAFAGLDGVVRWTHALGERTELESYTRIALARLAWRTPYAGLKYAPSTGFALPDRFRSVESRFALRRDFSTRVLGFATIDVTTLRDHGGWDLETAGWRAMVGLGWKRRGSVL